MKMWKIPVTWEMCGIVEIEAKTLQEAMDCAKDDEEEIPLPDDSIYVDGSWKLSYNSSEVDYVRKSFNNGQQDEH